MSPDLTTLTALALPKSTHHSVGIGYYGGGSFTLKGGAHTSGDVSNKRQVYVNKEKLWHQHCTAQNYTLVMVAVVDLLNVSNNSSSFTNLRGWHSVLITSLGHRPPLLPLLRHDSSVKQIYIIINHLLSNHYFFPSVCQAYLMYRNVMISGLNRVKFGVSFWGLDFVKSRVRYCASTSSAVML